MKNIFAILLLLVIPSFGFAFEQGQWNVHAGIGGNSVRGIFGISAERFWDSNHALTLASGIDFVGATTTVGFKYFPAAIPAREGAWGKCFFLIECDQYNYAGLALQYAGGSIAEVKESDVLVRSYDIESKVLGLVTFGLRSVFKNSVTFDVELTYKNILTGGRSTQTFGPAADDERLLKFGQRGLGAGIAVGYLF